MWKKKKKKEFMEGAIKIISDFEQNLIQVLSISKLLKLTRIRDFHTPPFCICKQLKYLA